MYSFELFTTTAPMSDDRTTLAALDRPSERRQRHPEYLLIFVVIAVALVEVIAWLSGALGQRSAWLRAVLGMSPWLVLTTVFLALYRGPAPRFAERMRRYWPEWITHVLLVAVVALIVGSVLRVAHNAIGMSLAPWPSFLAECVVLSWIVVLPSNALERARLRERAALQRVEVAERAALDAQLRALQAQTNPHFLFNSLNVVAGLIHEDPALAERTLERFASLFRYSIEGARAAVVTLERELAFVEDYLEVQRLRYGARLDSTLSIDASALALTAPPLLLQPLVENAVLHGLSDGRALRVWVTVERSTDGARIVIADDGPGLGRSAHRGTQSSLDVLRRRVAAIDGATLSVLERDGGGVEATLFLPALEKSR